MKTEIKLNYIFYNILSFEIQHYKQYVIDSYNNDQTKFDSKLLKLSLVCKLWFNYIQMGIDSFYIESINCILPSGYSIHTFECESPDIVLPNQQTSDEAILESSKYALIQQSNIKILYVNSTTSQHYQFNFCHVFADLVSSHFKYIEIIHMKGDVDSIDLPVCMRINRSAIAPQSSLISQNIKIILDLRIEEDGAGVLLAKYDLSSRSFDIQFNRITLTFGGFSKFNFTQHSILKDFIKLSPKNLTIINNLSNSTHTFDQIKHGSYVQFGESSTLESLKIEQDYLDYSELAIILQSKSLQSLDINLLCHPEYRASHPKSQDTHMAKLLMNGYRLEFDDYHADSEDDEDEEFGNEEADIIVENDNYMISYENIENDLEDLKKQLVINSVLKKLVIRTRFARLRDYKLVPNRQLESVFTDLLLYNQTLQSLKFKESMPDFINQSFF
ncbi:hypothetical protein PPL_12186 [Heterostelium album PN500]|uniref:Uncharacterized protein n=1 Tax=Heterostelium pallidum (strain ATCC 26659 / Pp 5 / PN500) TaxID=670386 RepID=D3BLY2_HETP5|nr:hypothetical protein PPL_12186 [Heterostelium album PN500]EFA77583.1 hypothetical protein PPL_12186 [Heterostelium album PN500]|eukprot:XP_020429711.1 hypothetical protein PPL_12186 [Heterostelium album PN500]